ncbi:MAG: hypothetical protein ABL962_17100 [Fimbriimonadaceae bacterium]
MSISTIEQFRAKLKLLEEEGHHLQIAIEATKGFAGYLGPLKHRSGGEIRIRGIMRDYLFLVALRLYDKNRSTVGIPWLHNWLEQKQNFELVVSNRDAEVAESVAISECQLALSGLKALRANPPIPVAEIGTLRDQYIAHCDPSRRASSITVPYASLVELTTGLFDSLGRIRYVLDNASVFYDNISEQMSNDMSFFVGKLRVADEYYEVTRRNFMNFGFPPGTLRADRREPSKVIKHLMSRIPNGRYDEID